MKKNPHLLHSHLFLLFCSTLLPLCKSFSHEFTLLDFSSPSQGPFLPETHFAGDSSPSIGPRSESVGFSTDRRVYVFGGRGFTKNGEASQTILNQMWAFDLPQRAWKYLGGYYGNSAQVENTILTATSALFDDAGRKKKNFPGSRTHHSGCFLSGAFPNGSATALFWVFGGESSSTLYHDLWNYDPAKNEWQNIHVDGIDSSSSLQKSVGLPSSETSFPGTLSGSNTPSSRHSHSQICAGLFVYIFGGVGLGAFDGTQVSYLNDVWRFDVSASAWQFLRGSFSTLNPENSYPDQPLLEAASWHPSGRKGAAIWAHGDFIYVFGGMDSSMQMYNDLWRFNTNTFLWSLVYLPVSASFAQQPSSALFPASRYFPAFWSFHLETSANDQDENSEHAFLYLFSGKGIFPSGDQTVLTVPLADFWQFDLSNQVWTLIADSSSRSFLNPSSVTSSPNDAFYFSSGILPPASIQPIAMVDVSSVEASSSKFVFLITGFESVDLSGNLWALKIGCDHPFTKFPDCYSPRFASASALFFPSLSLAYYCNLGKCAALNLQNQYQIMPITSRSLVSIVGVDTMDGALFSVVGALLNSSSTDLVAVSFDQANSWPLNLSLADFYSTRVSSATFVPVKIYDDLFRFFNFDFVFSQYRVNSISNQFSWGPRRQGFSYSMDALRTTWSTLVWNFQPCPNRLVG